MKEVKFLLRSASPLLMHSARLADPLDPWAKELKRISGKRKKTDADHAEMARIEFLGGLYLLPSRKPCLPSMMIEASLLGAGRSQKRGKQVQSGLIVKADAELVYDGPKDPDELAASPEFTLRNAVKVGTARVMRTRPMFRKWEATVTVAYHDTDLDHDVVVDLMRIAGEIIGLGDWRPKFGRFTSKVVK